MVTLGLASAAVEGTHPAHSSPLCTPIPTERWVLPVLPSTHCTQRYLVKGVNVADVLQVVCLAWKLHLPQENGHFVLIYTELLYGLETAVNCCEFVCWGSLTIHWDQTGITRERAELLRPRGKI